jgi:hypothetical protein
LWPLLQGSNVYSTSECCLLAWMSAHVQKAFPQQHAHRVADFGSGLADGVVLFALLINHWPALAVHKGRLRWGRCPQQLWPACLPWPDLQPLQLVSW